MAVAMFIRLPISLPAYDHMLANMDLDVSPPAGEILHFAAETADGVDVCEIWQTYEAAENFLHTVLEPMLHVVGVHDPVEYAICPLHNLYAPDLDAIERIGAVSLPGLAPGAALR
jgi:hypothetical protein